MIDELYLYPYLYDFSLFIVDLLTSCCIMFCFFSFFLLHVGSKYSFHDIFWMMMMIEASYKFGIWGLVKMSVLWTGTVIWEVFGWIQNKETCTFKYDKYYIESLCTGILKGVLWTTVLLKCPFCYYMHLGMYWWYYLRLCMFYHIMKKRIKRSVNWGYN